MIVKRYVNKDHVELVGGYFYLNRTQVEILHKNIYRLEFKHLYSSIIVGLYDEGYIKEEIEKLKLTDEIEKLKTYLFFEEKYKPQKEQWILFVNGFFGRLYAINSNLANTISGYIHPFWEELRNQTDNILLIDTDAIWYKDNLPQELFDKLGLQYITIPIDYFYLINIYTYIEVSNGELKTKGIERKTGITKENQIHLNNFKVLLRQDKINQILDEN